MPSTQYYATYCRFHTEDKREGSLLFSADCLVGDIFKIEIPSADGVSCARLVNRFDDVVGYLDIDMTEQVQLAQARGWETHAILASVYSTHTKDGIEFWGEVVVMCFTPNTPFEPFMHTVASSLATGVRPRVDLGKGGIDQVLSSHGTWLPDTRTPKITPPEGSVLIKDARSFNENIVELAREEHPGCMAVMWALTIAFIAGVIYLVWRFLIAG